MEKHYVASTFKETEPHYVTYLNRKPIFEFFFCAYMRLQERK